MYMKIGCSAAERVSRQSRRGKFALRGEKLERRGMLAALVSGDFGWALEIGLIGPGDSHRIAADADGNVYVAGGFFGTHDFDPGAASVVLASSSDDVFLAKFNSVGQLQWLNQFGGTSDDLVDAICVDSEGNVTLSGRFQGAADFDPGAGTAVMTGESGYDSVYVVQLSSAGAFRWAKLFDGPGDDKAAALATDESGNVLVAGSFASSCDFDPGPGASILDVTTGNKGNNFVVSLSVNGDFRWVRQYKATIRSSAFDASGNALIAGTFYSQMAVDPANAANKLLSGNSGSAAFVLKLTSAGDFVWARHFGGVSGSYGGMALGIDLAVDSQRNVLLGGYFKASAGFDSGVSAAVLNARGNTDAFIMKWSPSGSLLWVKDFGSSGYDRVGQVAVLAEDKVVVAGEFEFTVDFGFGATGQERTSAGRENAFVLGLTADGSFDWVKQFGGANATTFTESMAARQGQDVLIAGRFVNSIMFLPEGATAILKPRDAGTAINGATSGGDRASASGYWGGFAMLVKGPDRATTPSAPQDLSVSPLNGSAQLAWSAPASDGGAMITDYVIQCSSNWGSTWSTCDDPLSSALSATVTGLMNGVSYVFRVAAVNRVGTGEYSVNSAPVKPVVVVSFDVQAGQTLVDTTLRTGPVQLMKRGAGGLVLNKANGHSGGTVVESGPLVIRNSAALGSGPLTVGPGATVKLELSGAELSVASCIMDEGARIDVGDSLLSIPYEGYSLPAIVSLLEQGHAADWTGATGICSTTVSALPGGSVGYRVDGGGSITFGFAVKGDATLDGAVDILDISAMLASQKFNTSQSASWSEGDFNYDGVFDILDLSEVVGSSLFNAGPYIPVRAVQVQAQAESAGNTLSANEMAFLAMAQDATGLPVSSGRRVRSKLSPEVVAR